jgi:hypothetical protein
MAIGRASTLVEIPAAILADAPTPSWAAVATAAASVITAIGGFIIAIGVLIPSLRIAKSTHKIVNQAHTDAINYQNALVRSLKAHGIEIPIDQSLPNGGTQGETT